MIKFFLERTPHTSTSNAHDLIPLITPFLFLDTHP
jgi:hypothetical protein